MTQGITERECDRSFLPQSFLYLTSGAVPGADMRFWNCLEAGSTVPLSSLFGRSGPQLMEHRPSKWRLDVVNRGLDVYSRTQLKSPGGSILYHLQTDGRMLWGGQSVYHFHQHAGHTSFAAFTVAAQTHTHQLAINHGAGTRTLRVANDIGTNSYPVTLQVNAPAAYATVTLNWGTGSKIYYLQVNVPWSSGLSDDEVAIRLRDAIRADVASGLIPNDVWCTTFTDVLSIYRYNGTLTLSLAASAGFAVLNASQVAIGAFLRVSPQIDVVAQATELVNALQWDKQAGNLPAELSFGRNGAQVTITRPAPGTIALSTTGASFASLKDLGSGRPWRGKLRVLGRTMQERYITEEHDFILEASAPGAAADFKVRTDFAYKLQEFEIEDQVGHTADAWIAVGFDWRWNSTRVHLLAAGSDTQTYTVSDGTLSRTFELDNNAAVTGGRTLVTIGGSASATATNLAAAINAAVGLAQLRSTLIATAEGNSVLIWDTAAASRASITHSTSASATFYLIRDNGAFGIDEFGFKIGVPWLCSSIRDLTCVKVDRTPTRNVGGVMPNNSRGVYALDLVRGNGTRAPYFDPEDNSLVVNGYAELLNPTQPNNATFTLEPLPYAGRHFLIFQYDPVRPEAIKPEQLPMDSGGSYFRAGNQKTRP